LLALIVGLVIGLNWAGRPSSSEPTVAAKSRPITAMHFFGPDAGWVLSAEKLLTTRDGGAHWRDITPAPREPPIELSNAHFLDPAHGWTGAVGGFGTKAVQTFRTADGGTTWRSSQVIVDEALYLTFDFLDPQHGWLVVATQTGSGFISSGRLFQTADGGATWSELPPPPSGHAVRFINLSTGWNVGGARFDQLYITRDGGHVWQQQNVPAPPAYADTSPAHDLPTLVDSRFGVLPVMFADGSVQLDFSTDGGTSWTIDAARAPLFIRRPPYAQYEAPVPATFVGNGVMAVVLGTELKLHTVGAWTSIKPRGFEFIYAIEFVNPRIGWAVSSRFTCAGSGSASRCDSQQDLLRTVDGGRSWTTVPVRYSG
jgi:photosystem II stability/assembly factor-like uncharacterized protein